MHALACMRLHAFACMHVLACMHLHACSPKTAEARNAPLTACRCSFLMFVCGVETPGCMRLVHVHACMQIFVFVCLCLWRCRAVQVGSAQRSAADLEREKKHKKKKVVFSPSRCTGSWHTPHTCADTLRFIIQQRVVCCCRFIYLFIYFFPLLCFGCTAQTQ